MGGVHVSGYLGVGQKEENSGRGEEERRKRGLMSCGELKTDSQDERPASAEKETT